MLAKEGSWAAKEASYLRSSNHERNAKLEEPRGVMIYF
jgi:hypothetical protein